MIDQSANPDKHLIDATKWLHTKHFKLKDKQGRGGIFVNLEKAFGFRPEWIAVTKVAGQHDAFVISVEKTPEIIAAEKQILDNAEKIKNATQGKEDTLKS